MGNPYIRFAAKAVWEQRRAFGRPAADVSRRWRDAIAYDGLCIVKDFLTAEICQELRGEIERLQRAYPASIRLASNGADRRMFGAEAGSEVIAQFAAREDILDVARWQLGADAVNAFTLAGAIAFTPDNLGSGEGWHRDAFFGQFKAILYLTDVTVDSGAFEFVRGSHRLNRKLSDHRLYGVPLTGTRITDDCIARLQAREPQRVASIVGPAGTLLLVDPTGIHRGRPLNAGSRMALTNYYYRRTEITEDLLDHFKPILGRHVLARRSANP